jgi:hypothetical protein
VAAVYMLGGRAYRSATTQTSIRQDNWTMALYRRHRVLERTRKGEDLVGILLDSNAIAGFLAGVLAEDDKPWTFADAKANEALFERLQDTAADPETRTAFYDALTLVLDDFFANGGSSWTASPTSPANENARKARKPRGQRRPRVMTPTNDTASGPASSPPSPSSTASA